MSIYITSTSAVSEHGVFVQEVQPPAEIQPTGSGRIALVGQFPWGPDGVIYEPPSIGEAKKHFAPPGMNRLRSGYLALLAKAFPELVLVRVLGPTAAKATATLATSVPATIMTVTAKYKGTEGNSITGTVSAATDGDTNHFNFTASVTGASGTYTETVHNINVSGTGTDAYPTSDADLDQLLLIGGFTKVLAGRPANGSATFSGGVEGTLVAASYVGTAESGDKGLALLESDKAVRHVFVDDCGTSLRAAVNAGLKAHAELMGDRIAYVNGDSGVATVATVRTDAAAYSSVRVVFADPWVWIYDDTTGSRQLVPGSGFQASAAARLPPSTSIAWKSDVVQAFLGGIVDLEYHRGAGAGASSKAGVATFIRESGGGFAIEAGVVTIAAANPAKRNLTRTRIGDYIAVSLAKSLRPYVDAPNVKAVWDLILPPVHAFMETLKLNATTNPIGLPHVVDYAIGAIEAANTVAGIQRGDLFLPMQVKTSAGIERLVFLMQFGETVSITLQ